MAPRINIPPLTRGLIVALFAFTILNAGARYRTWSRGDRSAGVTDRIHYAPYLTIVPGTSIIFPWVFVTAAFAEQNPVGAIITGATLFYGGRYLERAWSSREYTKFILIVALVPNLLSFISYISLFVVTRNPSLVSTAISGGLAIQAAFLVSFKQLVPEHTVTILRGVLRIRVKHFPAIFVLANTISGVAFGTDTAMLLSWYGFLVSWVYLRFYRISPSLAATATGGESFTIRGDASDTFAFAYFFPDPIQPPIAAAADAIYNALVALRICTPFSAADVDASNEQASARGEGELPSLLHPGRGRGRREEAERRRALALRALDQRLNASANRGVVPPQPPSEAAAEPVTVSVLPAPSDSSDEKPAEKEAPNEASAPAAAAGQEQAKTAAE